MHFDKEHTHDLERAVIYVRVSSAAQVRRGHGLESQEMTCRQYAAFRGYDVVEVYRDDITGKTSDRPGMKALLAFLRSKRRSENFVVIIDDISRLARDIRAHMDLRDAIEAVGAELESPNMFFGQDSKSQYFERIQALNAEFHRKQNVEQVVSRMKARTLNGYYLFSPVLGYRFELVAGHGKMLVRDEPAASIVAEALEGFASGRFHRASDVGRFLQTFPNVPRDPHGDVRRQYVHDLLRRPLYAGLITVNKWKLYLHEGKHEPLISVQTYRKIQARLEENGYARPQHNINQDFPLRGFVNCASCERPMTAGWSKGRTAKYPYYLCQTKDCAEHRKSVRKEAIEGDFRALLVELTPAPELLAMARKMLSHLWDALHKRHASTTLEAKAKAASITQKSEALMQRLINADDPKLVEVYEKQIVKLEGERRELLEKAKMPISQNAGFEQIYRTACAFLSNPCKIWDSGILEHQKLLLKLVFPTRVAYAKK